MFNSQCSILIRVRGTPHESERVASDVVVPQRSRWLRPNLTLALVARDQNNPGIRLQTLNYSASREIERFPEQKGMLMAVFVLVKPDERLDTTVGEHGDYLW